MDPRDEANMMASYGLAPPSIWQDPFAIRLPDTPVLYDAFHPAANELLPQDPGHFHPVMPIFSRCHTTELVPVHSNEVFSRGLYGHWLVSTATITISRTSLLQAWDLGPSWGTAFPSPSTDNYQPPVGLQHAIPAPSDESVELRLYPDFDTPQTYDLEIEDRGSRPGVLVDTEAWTGIGSLSPLSEVSVTSTPAPTVHQDAPASPRPSPPPAPAECPRDVSSPPFACQECNRVFDRQCKLNHHRRYHTRPHQCSYAKCRLRFGTKTHLDRHMNGKHEKTQKYFCTEPACRYSKRGGKFFCRKDNWRRHREKVHRLVAPSEPDTELCDSNGHLSDGIKSGSSLSDLEVLRLLEAQS